MESARQALIRVLLLEDSPADIKLLLHHLQHGGLNVEWECVDTEAAFLARLDAPPDIILSDYNMPQFEAPRALQLLRERNLDVPLVIVSGSIGEDTAVAAIKLGAADYLLKDRLGRLGEAVRLALEQRRLRQEKRQIEQSLQDYILMLAHELRGPLAPLRAAIEIVRCGGGIVPVQVEALDTAGRCVDRLASMVNDLLEAGRITHGQVQVHLERLDLARLARTAVEDRRLLFTQKEVALTVVTPQTPLWVRGDNVRLTQILDNLLDNALRFTDRAGSVAVEVHDEPTQVVLCVRDTGIGIEPAVLPRIFEPFMQADRTLERRRGGLGLGLAVAAHLVKLHHGEIHAASGGLTHGAAFTVRLPREPEPAAVAGLPDAFAPAAASKRRILVIEDNHDAAHLLKTLLTLMGGHDVQVAHSGPEGLAKALSWRPEFVFSDIGLPGLNGYEVARALRQRQDMSSMRLIAISGYTSPEDRRRSREAGFDVHLAKPAGPDEIQRLLSTV